MLKIFFSLARLGQGSIQQVQGEMMRQGIAKEERLLRNLWDQVGECHIKERARCIMQFSSQEPQNLETMTRARMAAARSCVCYVSNEDAGKWRAMTGECLAATLYECFVHQVTTIGDADKMAQQRHGQQLNFSYCMWAFYCGWTELSWQWIYTHE